MQKITPFLWFRNRAEEAIYFYTSLFRNSEVVSITKYGDDVPEMKGKVITGVFKIGGQEFMAIDGGTEFPFTQAISFFVNCEDQAEVDYLWNELSSGGQEGQCGWLKDKFGISWQIIPKTLGELMNDPDPEKAQRVMRAMLGMKKIIIEDLKKAYQDQ